MSYRELTMIDVKEVLRRWQAQQSVRKIGRETGIDRKTVGRYVATAIAIGLPLDRALSEAEVHEVAQREQSRPLSDATDERTEIAQHKQRIEAWLAQKRPLRLSKIHTLLVRDGVRASYATLRRFAIEELSWRRKAPTILLEDPPAGQEAQIDFGKMGRIVDSESGESRVLWALVITLSFSRYAFVWPTFVQTTAAVCEGLDRAWRFFDAMVKTIVPDNMKAIVKTPDALSPVLAPAFMDYVQARGIFVDPARVRSPKDKARVENQVPYVRESWFDGETFTGIDDARRSAEAWCKDVAGARVHGSTREVPKDVFLAREKPHMLAPPTAPFDVPLWADAKVHPDHHIQVARALYSVPTRYLHKSVRVRADSTTVKIYLGTELIKMHPRRPPGARSTDTSDYPVGKSEYALRSVDALVKRAKDKGTHVGIYAERIVSGPLPWTRMRAAYALLSLCEKFGDGRVEAVCQSALAFDVVDVARITKMLKTAAKPAAPSARGATVVQLPLPRFARTHEHFVTRDGVVKKEGV
jgi:transposase